MISATGLSLLLAAASGAFAKGGTAVADRIAGLTAEHEQNHPALMWRTDASGTGLVTIDTPPPVPQAFERNVGRAWAAAGEGKSPSSNCTGFFNGMSARLANESTDSADLAACMARLCTDSEPVQTVLVATSGDTGGAVVAAFHRRPGFRVVILYPDDKVSARQAHQLGAFGDNVHAFKVSCNFDDCRRLVKQALNDQCLAREFALTSANSISIGRLLPEISYYAHAVSQLHRAGHTPVEVIVPTGNLGNALACILGRDMGLPIGEIVLATNANPTLAECFSGSDYRGRPGIATLANAMDVGDPSNFERQAWFYRNKDLRRANISAVSIDDATIRARLTATYANTGQIVCPHTACALEALALRRTAGNPHPHLIAATAHPAKFENVVEPLIGQTIEPPLALDELLKMPSHVTELAPDYQALRIAMAALV